MNMTISSAIPQSTTNTSSLFVRGAIIYGKRTEYWNPIPGKPDRLTIPIRWKKPHRIFVNSMSDLFHPDVPVGFITDCFEVMAACPHHVFQILTKRPRRMLDMLEKSSPNVWLGVSCEDQTTANERILLLLQTPAAVRFISAEPLLGPIDLTALSDHSLPRPASRNALQRPVCSSLECLDWVIAGGESGPGARPMHSDWVRSLRDQCVAAAVPFFFKQWGGVRKKQTGRELDGRTWDEMPT